MMFKAGFSQCSITPEVDLCMGGYRLRRGTALGTHDDLKATCSVLSDGSTDLVLVSLDLLCLWQDLIDVIKLDINEHTGLSPQHILITCTHTHSGPDTIRMSGGGEQIESYLSGLVVKVISLVQEAFSRMENVNVSYLITDVNEVAFNRRLSLKDGSYAINIDYVEEWNIESRGDTDPAACAILFENESGVSGVIVNFTLHPTVEAIPGGPVVSFFNGAFGNINQIRRPGEWIATFEEARRIGETIAGMFINNLDRRKTIEKPAIKVRRMKIDIPRRAAVPTTKPHAGKQPAAADRRDLQASGSTFLTPEKERLYVIEASTLTDLASDTVELQLFRMGPIEIIALPGEIFVEYGLELKRRSGDFHCLVFGNSNGYIGYVPTREAFGEGGYETRLSLSSRLVPEAGENILKTIDQMRETL
jgi:hypothetical protein